MAAAAAAAAAAAPAEHGRTDDLYVFIVLNGLSLIPLVPCLWISNFK